MRARSLTVLVVDDEADSRELVGTVLRGLGHQCLFAEDGVAAWTLLEKEHVDVVLCDLNMPGMGGLELCVWLRARRGEPYVYVILMTAMADKAHFFQGMRAGADSYLTKPFEVEDLAVRMLSATRVIGMERLLARRNATLREEGAVSFERARIDPLTDSANRLRLHEDLEVLQARVARYGHRYTAALCDVDLFKQYNDAHGHLAGDVALKRIAGAIGGAIRRGDTLYRFGGEEFLVILPGQDLAESFVVMERVRLAVAALGMSYPGGILTISVGLAEMRNHGETCDECLRRADSALYAAKHAGRNRVNVDPTPGPSNPPSTPST